MALIGYARVSVLEEEPWLQHDALEAAGCKRVFTDRASGAVEERPELARLFDHLREGDTIVVTRLERIGRSQRDLVDTIGTLAARGVGLRSLDATLDTTGAKGKPVVAVCAALSEFELDIVRERAALAAVGLREPREARLGALVEAARSRPSRRAAAEPADTQQLEAPPAGSEDEVDVPAAARGAWRRACRSPAAAHRCRGPLAAAHRARDNRRRRCLRDRSRPEAARPAPRAARGPDPRRRGRRRRGAARRAVRRPDRRRPRAHRLQPRRGARGAQGLAPFVAGPRRGAARPARRDRPAAGLDRRRDDHGGPVARHGPDPADGGGDAAPGRRAAARERAAGCHDRPALRRPARWPPCRGG